MHELRRSWDKPPEKLDASSTHTIPNNIDIYKNIPKDKIPNTESLRDTYERVIPYYKTYINNINKNVLISAHGNSIRALCKYLFDLSNTISLN